MLFLICINSLIIYLYIFADDENDRNLVGTGHKIKKTKRKKASNKTSKYLNSDFFFPLSVVVSNLTERTYFSAN